MIVRYIHIGVHEQVVFPRILDGRHIKVTKKLVDKYLW